MGNGVPLAGTRVAAVVGFETTAAALAEGGLQTSPARFQIMCCPRNVESSMTASTHTL